MVQITISQLAKESWDDKEEVKEMEKKELEGNGYALSRFLNIYKFKNPSKAFFFWWETQIKFSFSSARFFFLFLFFGRKKQVRVKRCKKYGSFELQKAHFFNSTRPTRAQDSQSRLGLTPGGSFNSVNPILLRKIQSTPNET